LAYLVGAGGSIDALLVESVAIAIFLAAAVVGFQILLWLVVAGLAAHGIYDAFHARMIANPGVPLWWAPFCLAYDVVAAGYLSYLLLWGVIPVQAVGAGK
jgi:hypothetical protein